MTWSTEVVERLSHRVIGCAIEVELRLNGLPAESERRIPIEYKGQPIHTKLKIDLLVEGCIVVELKAVACIEFVHIAQVISYLKLTGYPAGLLMNFNTTSLRAGLKRLDHPTLYAKRHRPR